MPIWDQFDDFDLNVHGIPNPHRSTEVQRLRDVNGSRSWKAVPSTAEIRLAVYRARAVFALLESAGVCKAGPI